MFVFCHSTHFQGIGNFGATPSFASNVIIKDGTLGLTSHHCIHGNFNKNILIEHIACKDFETHGIQLNGFDHLTIRNVEIGPSSTKSYFRGEYGFARALLPRLMKVADENPDRKIRFDQREDEVTMSEMTEELIRKTNLLFDYVYNGNEPIITSMSEEKDWMNIKEVFYNPSGLPNGASMYGIFLNTMGESVMSYNLNTNTFSNQAILENIQIHDLRHKMTEYIRVSTKTMNPYGSVYLNPLAAPYDATQMLYSLKEEDLLSRPRYKGTIITDIMFALSEFTDNWDYLQSQLIFKDQTLPWAKGEDLTALNDNLMIGCNNDVMLQSGKGLMGIRMDGVKNAKMNSIQISNLFEETHLGVEDCGGYTSFDSNRFPFGGGHISQKLPMQVGFSGNTVQGIAVSAADNIKVGDVSIEGIQSHTGDAFGIAIWPSVNMAIDGDIIVDHVHAGWLIPEMKDTLRWESRPNRSPMSCAILNTNEYYSQQTGLTYVSKLKADRNRDYDIKVSNVYGFTYCDDHEDIKTQVGIFIGNDDDMLQDDDDEIEDIENIEDDEQQDSDGDSDVEDDDGFTDGITDAANTIGHPSGDHILVGTIIAVTILFCGFITMGYIAYVYCQHKRQQKETEVRAQLLLQQAQQQQYQEQQSYQNQQSALNASLLQSAQTQQQQRQQSNNLFNPPPFSLSASQSSLLHRIEEEEPQNHNDDDHDERTPLIKNVPAFNRMNL